jgi:hypothetical protein
MSLALNKILLANANANSTAAYFTAGTTALGNLAASVLPAGAYIIYPVANVAVQVNNSSAGNGFANVIANATGGFIVSDGINVQLKNVGQLNVSATYVVVGSEQAATGTYNT